MYITYLDDPRRITLVRVDGSIDAFRVPEVRGELQKLLDGGAGDFVLDLTNIEFMDSAGMSLLVFLLKRARQNNGQVQLVWPRREAVRRVLQLTRFDRIFAINETVDDARARFQLERDLN
jgi:anti-sigma B factor antagonist